MFYNLAYILLHTFENSASYDCVDIVKVLDIQNGNLSCSLLAACECHHVKDRRQSCHVFGS